MSFTSVVKNEISKLEILELEKISELSAIVQNEIKECHYMKITTENSNVARRVFSMLKTLFDVVPRITVRKGYNYTKNYLYILEFHQDVKKILESLGIYKESIREFPCEFIVADDDLKRAYLRGLFLIKGSINDPKTSRYHLEFLVNHESYANFISQLLNAYSLNSKVIKRDNKYMVYMKEAEKIGDFLRVIGASKAVFYYEDIRIYRDHKNMTNRLNNCEQANVDRVIATAYDQIQDIELLKKNDLLGLLEDKEKIVIESRLKYKEASLQELSEIISLETGQSITKSGLHHRFQKIKTLANKIRLNKL